MDGTLSADSTIQEHRDRGDTYNGQFYTSGPLVDGVLGLKAYGSLAKREKDDQQKSSTTATVKRRALRASPAAMRTLSSPGRRLKIMTLRRAMVSIVRIVTLIPSTKTALSARTTL
jgi:outer membrane receptor for ferrienterochelin and colicins